MNALLWIQRVIVILVLCIINVRSFACIITRCSIPNFCGSGRKCHTNPDTCQSECVCTDNVTHELCRAAEENVSTSSPVVSARTSTVSPNDITTPVRQNADCLKNYNKSLTMCLGGMLCLYGDCITDNATPRCACYPGAQGVFCMELCCLDCGPNGKCSVNIADKSQYCVCNSDYTGEGCATPKSMPNPPVQVGKEIWYLWLVGVCAGVLFVLLLLIVLSYLMWKHRYILIMKIVHYFQPYEDQDERTWDAFVSYRSDPVDEEFVLKKLFPMLEKMNFKLNIHQKDFIVGETIANNIIQAVENSRRTILVMSKNYVKSEFTRFEYQCAQQEMLQRKHRIIPVLLEDITEIKDTFDPTLKFILNSVTYIKWPGETNAKELQNFWKRLELSMPKMRKVKDEATVLNEDMTTLPANITIHKLNNKNHNDLFSSAENKSINEGQNKKLTKKDDTGHFSTTCLSRQLSVLLPTLDTGL